MAFLRVFAVFSLCLLLAACSSGPPRRVYPPQATMQELRVQPDGRIAASNELVKHEFAPTPAVKAALDAAFAGSRSVRYALAGRIADSEGRDDEFTYSSALDPVPGLPGVLR